MKPFLRYGLVALALLFPTAAFAAAEISTASGNIDASGTWSLIEPNTFLNSETANTALTTSYTGTNTLTPGAVTVQGIGVKLASLAASPTGTLSCRLVVTSGLVLVDSVTVNLSDLVSTAATATAEGGWIVFKFGSTHLLVAATPYEVQCETSVAAQVNLFSSGTTVWSQMLVTTTAQAPVAGDSLYVFGQLTGAGTNNAYNVTIETTANTNYGNVANTLVSPSISIGQYGTLCIGASGTCGPAASTAYLAEFAGPMVVYNGGVFDWGTAASPVPSTSSATLTLNSSVEGDTGIVTRNGGTFNVAGASGGRSFVKTHLTNFIAGTADNSSFTATISNGSGGAGTILNVTAKASGNVVIGQAISGGTISGGTVITGSAINGATCGASACTGSGGTGTYLVNNSQNVTSTSGIVGAASSVLVTADSTGWLSGDSIYIAATNITAGTVASYLGDAATLTSNASGTSVSLTAAVTNTHTAAQLNYTSTSTGIAYSMNMYADVVLLNRNVIIQGSSTTTNGYLYFEANSNFAATWVEFNEISGLTTGKRGIEADTGPLGTFSLTYFSFINSHSSTMVLAPTNTNFGGTSSAYVVVQHGVFYNDVTTTNSSQVNFGLAVFTSGYNPYWEIDDVAVILVGTGTSNFESDPIYIGSYIGQFSNISWTGSSNNNNKPVLQIQGSYSAQIGNFGGGINTWGPLTSYSNLGYPMGINNASYGATGKISGLYIWHEQGRFNFAGITGGAMVFDPFYLINSNFGLYNMGGGSNITVRNGVIGWDLSCNSACSPLVSDSITINDTFDNMELCPLGAVGGVTFLQCAPNGTVQTLGNYISLHHDLTPGAGGGNFIPGTSRVYLRNTSLLNEAASYPTQSGQESYYSPYEYIVQDCAGCSPVKHAAWVAGGFLSYDAAITHTTGFSERMTPKVMTFSGYIAGTVLTITSPNPTYAWGGILFSNGSGFIPGTMITGNSGYPTYSVNFSQTVGSSGSPVQFQSYFPQQTGGGTLRRLQSAPHDYGVKAAVANGVSNAQVCVYLRPSINTDAAPPWGGSAVTYNGDAPRMLVRQNPYMGVQSDTVIATSSPTAGLWGQFCGTLPTAPADGEFEVVVDADQTFTSNAGGSINLAEWSCTNCNLPNSSEFWWNGAPADFVAPASTGGGFMILR
jgi:hypothetical protein